MSHTHRMRFVSFSFFVLLTCPLACSKPATKSVQDQTPRSDKDAPFDPPNQYPAWAYDAPYHAKPAEELKPDPAAAKPGDPPHYFTKEKVVLIRRPTGYVPEEIPQVAIWWTSNSGASWQKAGFFGREQSFFAFETAEDGDYGVRFAGPGQETAQNVIANPERVYHVDTTLPVVEVSVDPEQTWYEVGQSVTITWNSSDVHLIENPVSVVMVIDQSPGESRPVEIKRDQAPEGSLAFALPQDTLEREVRFRVEALDRAGNLGTAFSHALQVVPDAAFPPSQGPVHPTPLPEPPDAIEEHARLDATPEAPKPADIADAPSTADSMIAEEQPLDTGIAAAAQTDSGAPTSPQAVNESFIQPEAEPLMPGGAPSEHTTTWTTPFGSPGLPATTLIPADSGPSDTMAEEQPLDPPGAALDRILSTPDNTQRAPQGTESEDEEPISARPSRPTRQTGLSDLEPLEDLADLSDDDAAPAISPGLGVPMPATVSPSSGASAQPAHPWRIIGEFLDTSIETVWGLPKPRPAGEAKPIFEGRMLAEEPLEPESVADKQRSLAGTREGGEADDPLDNP